MSGTNKCHSLIAVKVVENKMVSHVVGLVLCSVLLSVQCEIGKDDRIIIVGAGAAGLAALTRLLEHNFTNVVVFEPEERIGGRILSTKLAENFIDLGAEFCHGEKENVVFEMADQWKVLVSLNAELDVYYSADGSRINEDIQEILLNISHSIHHRKTFLANDDDPCYNVTSEGVCLNTLYKQFLSSFESPYQPVLQSAYTWLKNYKSVTESALNLDDVNLVSDYEECKGDQMLSWQGLGYHFMLNQMLEKYEWEKLIIRKSVRVINHNFFTRNISVILDDSTTEVARHLIFTPSLGVLKAEHETLFRPPLPFDKQSAIRDIGFGSLVKIGLRFSDWNWTQDTNKIFSCIWSPEDVKSFENEEYAWVTHFTAFTTYLYNPSVLMAWFAGENVPKIELLPDGSVMEGLEVIISKCFDEITWPSEIVRSNWLTNSNFRGSFSYDAVNDKGVLAERLRKNLARPLTTKWDTPQLLFAGEATHSTKFGTVHGAIESGYREADRLIEQYIRKNSEEDDGR